MDDTSRKDAFRYLEDAFDLQHAEATIGTWLSNGEIPEDYQPKIVLAFQNILRAQELRIRRIKVNF